MACFLTPLTLGLVISLMRRLFKKISKGKLQFLETMLLGGSLMLIIEHIWRGEIVPYPPFLTAMSNPEEYVTLLNEIAIRGSAMALTVTGVWAFMVNLDKLVVKIKTMKITTLTLKR